MSLPSTSLSKSTLLPARLLTIDSRELPVQIPVDDLTTREAMVRALKPLAILWGIAAGFLLMPIIHFVVPPIAFVTGLVLFIKTSLEKKLIRFVELICPVCSKPIVVKDTVYRPEIKIVCESCRNHLKIVF
jgi:hypothetical protein